MVISISASKELYKEDTKLDKPLNADNTIINAIVPTHTPVTEIPEMILIALCDFLEIR